MILGRKGVEMTKGLKIAFIVTGSLIGALLLSAAGFFIAHEVISRTDNRTQSFACGRLDRQGRKGESLPQYGIPRLQAPKRGQVSPWEGQPGMGYQGYMNRGPESNEISPSTPLTITSAKTAVDTYLAHLNSSDLKVAEIILFSNNAYARIIEKSTGTGAFELLVNENGRVSQEMGANMMWNLKFGMMGRFTGKGNTSPTPNTVTADQALSDAQKWLDTNIPGSKVSAAADAFYGYYTIEYTVNGTIAGMVSVNGFTGDFFPHTWHGTFVAIQEY
jgi:hypothetical protein